MQNKAMEQPGAWWQDLLKWLENNWFQLGVFGLVSQAIDRLMKFATKMVDGSLKKISIAAMEEKSKEIKSEMDKIDAKLNHLINSLIDKK